MNKSTEEPRFRASPGRLPGSWKLQGNSYVNTITGQTQQTMPEFREDHRENVTLVVPPDSAPFFEPDASVVVATMWNETPAIRVAGSNNFLMYRPPEFPGRTFWKGECFPPSLLALDSPLSTFLLFREVELNQEQFLLLLRMNIQASVPELHQFCLVHPSGKTINAPPALLVTGLTAVLYFLLFMYQKEVRYVRALGPAEVLPGEIPSDTIFSIVQFRPEEGVYRDKQDKPYRSWIRQFTADITQQAAPVRAPTAPATSPRPSLPATTGMPALAPGLTGLLPPEQVVSMQYEERRTKLGIDRDSQDRQIAAARVKQDADIVAARAAQDAALQNARQREDTNLRLSRNKEDTALIEEQQRETKALADIEVAKRTLESGKQELKAVEAAEQQLVEPIIQYERQYEELLRRKAELEKAQQQREEDLRLQQERLQYRGYLGQSWRAAKTIGRGLVKAGKYISGSDPRLKIRLKGMKEERDGEDGVPIHWYKWKASRTSDQLWDSLENNGFILAEPLTDEPFWSVSADDVAEYYPAAVDYVGKERVALVDWGKVPESLGAKVFRLNRGKWPGAVIAI
jgi:hypothetical protein